MSFNEIAIVSIKKYVQNLCWGMSKDEVISLNKSLI